MKNQILTACSLVMVLTFLLPSCHHEPDLSNYPVVKFAEVKTIINANCTQSGCHNNVDGDEFSLVTYDEIIGYVEPYKAYKSQLYRCITGKGKLMPPGNPLPDEQIRTIFVWIEQGAPNN